MVSTPPIRAAFGPEVLPSSCCRSYTVPPIVSVGSIVPRGLRETQISARSLRRRLPADRQDRRLRVRVGRLPRQGDRCYPAPAAAAGGAAPTRPHRLHPPTPLRKSDALAPAVGFALGFGGYRKPLRLAKQPDGLFDIRLGEANLLFVLRLQALDDSGVGQPNVTSGQ